MRWKSQVDSLHLMRDETEVCVNWLSVGRIAHRAPERDGAVALVCC